MKDLKSLFLPLLALCLLSWSSAQTKFTGIAMSASVPSGWQIQEENYGQILMSNPNVQGALMFVEHGWYNEQMILQNMQQNIQEEGFQAGLASDVMQLENGNYIALYQGYAGQQEVIIVAVVSQSKLWQIGGVMTLILVTAEQFNDNYQNMAVEVSNTIRYRSFMSKEAQQKANMFKGRKLIRYSSYYTSDWANTVSVGSSSKTTINFCSSGKFIFDGYSDFSAGGGAFDGQVSSSNSEGVGLWSLMVVNNYMVIRLVSLAGEVNYMPIESYTDEGYYYINGDKWAIGGSSVCN
jgi:hypothetical protein